MDLIRKMLFVASIVCFFGFISCNSDYNEDIVDDLVTDSSNARAPGPEEDKNGDGAWDDGRDTRTGDPRDSPYYNLGNGRWPNKG